MICILAAAAFATDYSTMSLSDMQAMKGSVPESDRSSFQTEMKNKMQALSPEERKAAASSMRKSGSADASGSQMRNGTGGGMGSKRGMGR